ncbi:MAG: DUF378 domain-containing protein [Parcubacteria group bacterium]|nr:DUF378 domain-containing protein [Parcubacteria group bacterium]
MSALHKIVFILLVIGGLNWGVLAVSGWEVGAIFGGMGAAISRVIYILVGLAAVVELFTHRAHCTDCSVKKAM